MKKSSGVSDPTTGSVTETSRTRSRFKIALVVDDSRLSRNRRSSLWTMIS